MDETDITLCKLLLDNSRRSYDELASKLGLSINAVHKRVKALEELNIIRSFIARPSLTAQNVTSVWIFGRSLSKKSHDSHLKLQKNDHTYWVAYTGGEVIYVGGYLRDISELDAYSTFVRNEAQIDEPIVAILPSTPRHGSTDELHQLDYQIISSLHKDSRKPLANVASELNLTAKTVRNRLERMIDRQLIDLTLEWYPDASNDILSILHISLGMNIDRMKLSSMLTESLSPNLVFCVPFSNYPNQLVAVIWANTMRKIEELHEKVSEMEDIDSVTSNVLQIGYSFETWRDKAIAERAMIHA